MKYPINTAQPISLCDFPLKYILISKLVSFQTYFIYLKQEPVADFSSQMPGLGTVASLSFLVRCHLTRKLLYFIRGSQVSFELPERNFIIAICTVIGISAMQHAAHTCN